MDIRTLCADDLELICRHREAMFRDAGKGDDVLRPMTAHFREWLRPRLANGSYFGFMMSDGGTVVAGIGLMLIDWPPHPAHPLQDQRGYVLNVFVEPDYRHRGLARALMRLADEEFGRRGIGYAVLHATDKGRPLYLGMGWNGTTEMAKTPEASPEGHGG
ncbi:GNAT family N-acetyltransferase [Dyella jiangningensis]|uniref:GNAT family N-acetyltransferase n=1 Tax=Dyella jiangningensis TaxID=1379159 RepID=A0A328NVE9_9GAMM|nr:GNAT family N-acetyltransferase [Dyella jiangningensis]RAO74427.1 GNAT family N-acetyltransferase [Dyella jiangningensis]